MKVANSYITDSGWVFLSVEDFECCFVLSEGTYRLCLDESGRVAHVIWYLDVWWKAEDNISAIDMVLGVSEGHLCTSRYKIEEGQNEN